MSHLHRQCCAAFLVRDLQIDWRWGAEHFESALIDYTPDANWGNWAYRILPRPSLIESRMAWLTKHTKHVKPREARKVAIKISLTTTLSLILIMIYRFHVGQRSQKALMYHTYPPWNVWHGPSYMTADSSIHCFGALSWRKFLLLILGVNPGVSSNPMVMLHLTATFQSSLTKTRRFGFVQLTAPTGAMSTSGCLALHTCLRIGTHTGNTTDWRLATSVMTLFN